MSDGSQGSTLGALLGAKTMDVFWALFKVGVALVGLGLLTLVYLIPKLTPTGQSNTEFLSSRAALWCVAAGLVLILVAGLEVSVKDVLRGWIR